MCALVSLAAAINTACVASESCSCYNTARVASESMSSQWPYGPGKTCGISTAARFIWLMTFYQILVALNREKEWLDNALDNVIRQLGVFP